MATDILTVSSKGQVVLPAKLRRKLSINNGDHLAVYATDDVIMLKRIDTPTEEEFSRSLDEAREWAASVGYQPSDVDEAIAALHARKHAHA